jgi:hypothetical protein
VLVVETSRKISLLAFVPVAVEMEGDLSNSFQELQVPIDCYLREAVLRLDSLATSWRCDGREDDET